MTGVATAKRPKSRSQRRIRIVASVTLAGLIVLSAILYSWFGGGRERLLLLLQPGFTVTAIDREAQTLKLSRIQESFVVSCGNHCDAFEIGKRYSMTHRGAALELTRRGEKIVLPILREHYEFETPPGGHG
ncbi:MAG: hypothetical protein JOZ80_09785 [Acidobacteriaceae bacterium]|nr:hypothetical protein [Acidobacteriaceae bacterium]